MDPVFSESDQESHQDSKRIVITSENQKLTSSLPGIFLGFTLGAMAALVFDPRNGRRRRSYMKDQVVGRRNDLRDWSERVSKDFGNRIWGFYRELANPPSENVDDQTLMSRVRSEFGRQVRHSRAVHTEVSNGVVTLSGPVLSDEVRGLIRCVRRVPGVKKVINRLEVRAHADHISGLQGRGPEYLQ